MSPVLKVQRLLVYRGSDFHLLIENLVLGEGKLLCVTGPNGSGKTTLLECLSGLLQPSDGTISVSGKEMSNNLRPIRASIGLIPDDEMWFIKELCAGEYLLFLDRIYREAGVTVDMPARVTTLATALNFTAFSQPLESLSHGNKKKVQIIAGLMHRPKLLIIDELRNGLDPMAIIAAEALIKKEVEQNTCVIAATHDLWWAERMADEVLLLINGSVAAHKNVSTVTKKYGSLENLFITLVNNSAGQA